MKIFNMTFGNMQAGLVTVGSKKEKDVIHG
jgi:hypothetical protein